MERSATIFIAVCTILIIGVSLSGCSDSPDPGASDTVVPATTTGPLYSAGDIVRSASGSESPAWMVVSYDAASDSYSRALIYKNTDGSYGYRTNPNTEMSKRTMMEKVFTVKITTVTVESIPTAAPTTVATTATAAATKTTTSASTKTTTTSTAKPSIKAMSPEEGEAGTEVVTEITGSDFVSELKAELRRSGEKSIKATEISWYSSSSVTCTFDLPSTAKIGTWDIVVTNPNGLSGEYTNYFTVRGNETED